MLSKVLGRKGMQWLSPVNAHHRSQSRAWRCASEGSCAGAAKMAQSIYARTGFTAARPHWAAGNLSEKCRRLQPQWKAVGTQARGMQRIAGTSPRHEQRLATPGKSPVQRLTAVFIEGCDGDVDRMRPSLQVTGYIPIWQILLSVYNIPVPPCSPRGSDCGRYVCTYTFTHCKEGISTGCTGKERPTE